MVSSESEMASYNQNAAASSKKEKHILCATLSASPDFPPASTCDQSYSQVEKTTFLIRENMLQNMLEGKIPYIPCANS